jgi:hypothetical protein
MYGNNYHSPRDKELAQSDGVDSYLVTPSGLLLKYNLKKDKETTISTKMPSDPLDPDRENKNDFNDGPKDEPTERFSDLMKRKFQYENEEQPVFDDRRKEQKSKEGRQLDSFNEIK